MCAILDAGVAHQVFGKERPPAGIAFFDWINSGGMRLVVGGKLLEELDNDKRFRVWRQQASQAGRVGIFDAQRVEARTADLHQDFGNQQLINNPRGKIYSTYAGGQLRESHRRLLRRNDLCRGGS